MLYLKLNSNNLSLADVQPPYYNMEKNAKVEAIRHKDVLGKEQLYLKISTEKGDYVINVGKTTIERVEELTKVEEPKGGKNGKL